MTSTQEYKRRTRGYWMIDGLPEITMGGVITLLTACQIAALFAPPSIAGFVLMAVPLGTIIFILLARRMLQVVKTRFTYPRTGYVEYNEAPRWQQILGVAVGFFFGAVLIALLFSVQLPPKWLPIITGLVFGFVMALLGFYVNVARFYILALVLALAGVGFWAAGVNGILGASLVLLLAGIWLLVTGVLTLWRYMQEHRKATP